MTFNLSRNGYTHEQVKDVLHMKHGSRQIRFRYFLLDKNENELAEITTLVESGSIEMAAFADIKRTAKFKLIDSTYKVDGEEKEINWNSDRIQVFVEFKVPGWFEQEEEFGTDIYFIQSTFPVEIDYRRTSWTKKEGGWVDFSLGVFLIASP